MVPSKSAWAAAFASAKEEGDSAYRALLLDAVAALQHAVEGNTDESADSQSVEFRSPAAASTFAPCLAGVEEGFSCRLSLYKFLMYNIPMLRQRSDLKRPLLGLMSYDLATRWALTGWCLPPFEPAEIPVSIWADNPVYEDMIAEDKAASEIWSDFRTAMQVFDVVWEEEAIILADRPAEPAWFKPSQRSEEATRPYLVELWQIVTLVLGHALQASVEGAAAKCVALAQRIVEKQILGSVKPDDVACAIAIYRFWLGPLLRLPTEKSGAEVRDWLKKVGRQVDKRLEAVTPMAMLERPYQGIKILQALYVDLDEENFYQKAKQLGQTGAVREKHEELVLRRNLRREQRAIGKQVHHQAVEVESLVLQDALRLQRKRAREQKRVSKVIAADAAEVAKMKTYGGTMDTSIAPYRASKKRKVPKGTPQN